MRPEWLHIVGKEVSIDYTDIHEHGLCLTDEWKIKIKEGLTQQEEQDTILHEIIHMLSDIGDLNLKERQVLVLSSLLYAVFRDNPDFIKYLIK